jgi:hypothetical protein
VAYKYAPWEIYTSIDGVDEFYEAGVLLDNGEETARKLSRAHMSTQRNYAVKLFVGEVHVSTWINGRRTT